MKRKNTWFAVLVMVMAFVLAGSSAMAAEQSERDRLIEQLRGQTQEQSEIQEQEEPREQTEFRVPRLPWEKIWDFEQNGEHEVTHFGEVTDYGFGFATAYQGEKSIFVKDGLAGEDWPLFFRTRDPEMVFEGGIKVGNSLSELLRSGIISGEATQLNAPEGQQAYQWKSSYVEDYPYGPSYGVLFSQTFTVYSQGDTITELIYQEDNDSDFSTADVDLTILDYMK